MEEGHHSSYLIWAGRAVNVNPTTTHHRKTLGSDFIPQGLNPSYDFSCSPLGHGAVSLKCRCNTELVKWDQTQQCLETVASLQGKLCPKSYVAASTHHL